MILFCAFILLWYKLDIVTAGAVCLLVGALCESIGSLKPKKEEDEMDE